MDESTKKTMQNIIAILDDLDEKNCEEETPCCLKKAYEVEYLIEVARRSGCAADKDLFWEIFNRIYGVPVTMEKKIETIDKFIDKIDGIFGKLVEAKAKESGRDKPNLDALSCAVAALNGE